MTMQSAHRASPTARSNASLASTLLVLAALGATPSAYSADGASRWPVTPEQRQTADQVAQAGVPLSALSPTAPDSHTVRPGDTLWGISSLFLTSPWRWPELWGMNRDQIRNPHLIYPGQLLRLVKSDGRARLELADAGVPGDTARLSPRVRDLGPDKEAIASIPPKAIEPFLSRPMVVGAGELEKYPRIVGTQEGRVFLGRGDTAYARGVNEDKVRDYHVFRPARPLFDPDDADRKSPIAYEAFYLGAAQVTKDGEVTTMRIQESTQEIGVGDRLVPISRGSLVMSYVPHRPDRALDGRIISIYGGVDQAGTQQIVALNRGGRDGLEIGHVLTLLETGATVRDRTVENKEFVKLPDERIGEMFVFRVADAIAYALVMRVTKPVKVGDRFVDPDSTALAESGAPRSRAAAAPVAPTPKRVWYNPMTWF